MQQDYYGSLHREAQQGQTMHGGLELNTEISWAICRSTGWGWEWVSGFTEYRKKYYNQVKTAFLKGIQGWTTLLEKQVTIILIIIYFLPRPLFVNRQTLIFTEFCSRQMLVMEYMNTSQTTSKYKLPVPFTDTHCVCYGYYSQVHKKLHQTANWNFA